MARKTHEEFEKQISDRYKGEYTVLGKYVNSQTKILVRHNFDKCGNYEWYINPNNFLRGTGCPVCKGGVKKGHEEFIKQIKVKYGNEYTILGKYIDNQTKILVRHNCEKCGNYEYEVIPNNILQGKGCPKCAGNIKKTTKEFKEELFDIVGDEYTVLGEYVNAKTKVKVRHNCKKCNNYEYEVVPNSILRGQGCPVCANKKAVLGVNTIYDTDPWMIDLGVNIDDAKKYQHSSNKKVTVTCPDCGRKKKMEINHVYRYRSIGCSCGDGKSYPEKFMTSVLYQLEVNYETEFSPNWIGNKRYDFYIPSLNMIIETHGGQHYNGGFEKMGGRTLEDEQDNDRYKKEIALQNGIRHYIVVDCRESDIDYIENSIINSELSNLLDLSKIDWLKCAEFANKNIVKEVCDYWNNRKEDETTVVLGKIFKLNKDTIKKYLKKGNKLEWCSYDSKDEVKKKSSSNGKLRGKKVEIFKDGKSLGVFASCSELSRRSRELFGVKLLNNGVSAVCRGNRKQYKGYTFKYIE